MKYVLALVLPPVAVLRYGRPRQVAGNIFLTLLGWLPGAVQACLIVVNQQAGASQRDQDAMEQQWRQEELERYRDRQRDRIAS